MKNLIDRIFWRLTERVYEEGLNDGARSGAIIERYNLIKALEEADSTCADWAINVIKETR